MSGKKLYTYEEIAAHNSRKDLWMVIHGKVYDITAFVDEVKTKKVSCCEIRLNNVFILRV